MTTRMEAHVEAVEKALEEQLTQLRDQNQRLGELNTRLTAIETQIRGEFDSLRQLLTTSTGTRSLESSNSRSVTIEGNVPANQLSLQQTMELHNFNESDVISWIARAYQYFLVQNILEEHKVHVALIALSSPAISWVQILLRRSPLITWEDFARELQAQFGTSSMLNAYEALRTTTHVGSLEDYIAASES